MLVNALKDRTAKGSDAMLGYGVDREWTQGLRELIRRYGELQSAAPGAAHRRGQRFNALVADMLRHWGINAQAGVLGIDGRDEIDVWFTLGDTPYVLEAKWLSRPLSADAGTKLAGRVRQRLRGTRGIVLSMSGYTKHAAPSAERGQQPEVVLLDRSHFEAMLSGLASPEHLIQALVRHASRRGGVHLSLTDLLLPERPPAPPTVTSTPDDGTPWNVIHETAGGITARPVLRGDPGWPAPRGLGTGFDRDHLLITTADGIIEVDTTRATTGWALALPGCRGTPLTRPDGSLITLCNYAVVKWHDRMLEIIGGGFTGNSNLLLDADGKSWVFDNTGSQYASLVSLTNLGDRLGEQQSHTIESDPGTWNAALLEQRRFFLAGGSYSAVVDLDVTAHVDRTGWFDSPHSGLRPVIVRDPKTVITAAYEQGVRGSVYQTNVATGNSGRLAHLAINSVQGLAALGNEAYLLADVRGNSPHPHPILIQLSGIGPFLHSAKR